MTPGVWVSALCAGLALALLVPPRERPRRTAPPLPPSGPAGPGWMLRGRPWWSLLAGIAAATFVGGTPGLVAGAVAASVAWVGIGRAEPPEVRRQREAVARDLPHIVTLVAAALRSGSAPGEAVAVVCAALPGPAADRLTGVTARLALGIDPLEVWESLAGDAELAPLGRTMARAQASGAPVVSAVERLAEELARRARADVEDRARAVGVKAALPLGLCLLPAFILIGIVPLVAGLMGTLGL